jgi:hypothetical protein
MFFLPHSIGSLQRQFLLPLAFPPTACTGKKNDLKAGFGLGGFWRFFQDLVVFFLLAEIDR